MTDSDRRVEGKYGWIPFHVAACSSEEFGTGAENLSDQSQYSNSGWQSERLGQFPIDLILRFHFR